MQEAFLYGDRSLESYSKQLNCFVELELVLHPRIEQSRSEAIELDYGMKDGVMKVEIRAAPAGYLLRLYNVDGSKEALLKTLELHLWLKNYLTLYSVGNLAIAPGFDLVTE